MPFFRSNQKTLTKLRTFKTDIAPIGFYFDFFSTSLFQIPLLPIPLRIDKISNGEPTLFIIPDMNKLGKLFKKLDLYINFELFYSKGIENFINYAQHKQKELTLREINIDKIRKWWISSKNVSACNPDLVTSFTFIISEFLKTYCYIEKTNLDLSQNKQDYKNALIRYSDEIIKYLRHKIEHNIFFIKKDNSIEKEKLYLERKQKYYPLVIKIPVQDLSTNITNEMGFVPYLIYDDLLDSFSYNIKLLKSSNVDSINLKVYQYNQIINKRSNIENINNNWNNSLLNNIDLEDILNKLNML